VRDGGSVLHGKEHFEGDIYSTGTCPTCITKHGQYAAMRSARHRCRDNLLIIVSFYCSFSNTCDYDLAIPS